MTPTKIMCWTLMSCGLCTWGPEMYAAETLMLPSVVVTATRAERSPFDTPQAITVIDAQDVQELSVAATPDLFRYAEAVYMQKTNLGGGSPFLRGLTGKQVLLLVDGVRLNNSFYRFGPHQYLNTIDPGMIDHIEVVRGPTSVLYGSDALGGTINIITKSRDDFSEPFDADGVLRGYYASAPDSGMVRAQVEGNWHGVGLIAGATGKFFDDLDGGGNVGPQIPSSYDEVDADLKLTGRLSPNQQVTVAQQYVRQYDVPKTSEVTLGGNLKFNYEPQERMLTYLDYRARELLLFDETRFNLSYHRQKEGEEIIARSAPTRETREITDVGTFGALIQLTNYWNYWGTDHRFTYGFDYYRDMYDTTKTRLDLVTGGGQQEIPGVPDGAFYQSWALYAQDEITLLSKLTTILGIRYSRVNTAGKVNATALDFSTDAVTGSVNLLYRLTPWLNLVGGWAKGFRAPNMEDFFGRVDFFTEIPNTDLKPEASFNKEVGLKFLYSDRAMADVYYFHADYAGFIERVSVGTQPDGTPIQQRQNLTDARIHGVEAGFVWNLTPQWALAGSLTWTEGEDKDTGEPLRRIPPLYGNLRVRYDYNSHLWFEAASVMADEQDRLAPGDITDPRIGPNGTPGYVIFDVRTGYTPFRNHEFLLALENLTDNKYKTHGSGLFNPGFNVAVTYQITFH